MMESTVSLEPGAQNGKGAGNILGEPGNEAEEQCQQHENADHAQHHAHEFHHFGGDAEMILPFLALPFLALFIFLTAGLLLHHGINPLHLTKNDEKEKCGRECRVER